jgi:hypothetical protein
MSTTDNIHPNGAELTADLLDATGAGVRIAEVGVVAFAGSLAAPPFLILAVVVAAPLIAIAAVVAAVVAVVAVPTWLVRRVVAHLPHQQEGTP